MTCDDLAMQWACRTVQQCPLGMLHADCLQPSSKAAPPVAHGSDPEALLGPQGLGAPQEAAPLRGQGAAGPRGLTHLLHLHCTPRPHP